MTTVPEHEHEPAPDQDAPAPAPREPEWLSGDARKNMDALQGLIESRQLGFRSDWRRVVIRLHGGEELEVGRVHGREAAVTLAREVSGRIETSTAAGVWPEVDGRFLRPGSIISIDVQRVD
jgi:hypothetical protein